MSSPPKNNNYIQILQNLKEKIRMARQQAALSVNYELLKIYWEIGFIILQQQKEEGWGAKIIDSLALDLKIEFPDFKGLSIRNLKYMRAFAEAWPDFGQFVQPMVAQFQNTDNQSTKFVQPVVAQIPWAHHIVILNKLKDVEMRLFYINKTIENNWSKNVLSQQIDANLHGRQGKAITNFENTLPKFQSDLARETMKSSYLIDFIGLGEEIQERELEKALIQNIKKFMLELGRGFAYVGNQYNIEIAGDDYFLDLLFYNYNLHCFGVFELKVGEFKPEYTGKLNFYINTIDEQIKGGADNQSIGILLCKTPNQTVVKYALKGINTPMGIAEFDLEKALPKELKSGLPTIEAIADKFKEKILDDIGFQLEQINK